VQCRRLAPPLAHLTAERRLLHRPKKGQRSEGHLQAQAVYASSGGFMLAGDLDGWSWTSTAGRNAQWAVGASPRQWPISGGILFAHTPASLQQLDPDSGAWKQIVL
jgi:hypothetical protein